MAKRFEVGKRYDPYGNEFEPILILRRTEKTVWVDNGEVKLRMRIKKDANGDEYVVDSCVPEKWRYAFTYMAKYEAV